MVDVNMVAQEHELVRMLVGTYLMAFVAGVVDATTYFSLMTDKALTTHLSGTTLKIGIYLAGEDYEYFWQLSVMFLCFFAGSICTGALTRRAELKSLHLLANCLMVRLPLTVEVTTRLDMLIQRA